MTRTTGSRTSLPRKSGSTSRHPPVSNDTRMHRGASDVELEWQRCLHLGWACRQYFSDEIGEPQRHRETVRESRAVEVQFRQRHDVTEHDFKVCIPLTMSTVIGLGT